MNSEVICAVVFIVLCVVVAVAFGARLLGFVPTVGVGSW